MQRQPPRRAGASRAKKTEAIPAAVAKKPKIWLDTRRVSFLYGHLAIDQRTVAELLRVPIAEVERHVREHNLVRGSARPYSRTIAQDLARIVGATLPDLKGAKNDEEWPKLRSFLRDAIVRELKGSSGTWFALDGFIADLPYRLAAAKARLTRSRLEFLAGDLAMPTRDIATLLSAAPSDVLAGLAAFKIVCGSSRHDELNSDSLRTLAHLLGVDEWDVDHAALSRWDRIWPAWKKGTREGLLRLAKKGELDLSVLDAFIAGIPKLAEERRRALKRVVAKAKQTPARNAA